MSGKMTRHAFSRLVQEDIEFLLKHSPDCLERQHIIEILEAAPEHYYGPERPPLSNGWWRGVPNVRNVDVKRTSTHGAKWSAVKLDGGGYCIVEAQAPLVMEDRELIDNWLIRSLVSQMTEKTKETE